MLQLEESAGIDITAIPFAGANEAKTALLGGHVTAIGLNVGEYSTSDQGALRAIGQFAAERSVLAPDLPTAAEQGFDVIQNSERGLATRCDVPEEIRAKLSDAVDQALADPTFLEKAEQQGLPLSYLSSAEWGRADGRAPRALQRDLLPDRGWSLNVRLYEQGPRRSS
jgi:tripartite-type tricarboxylate transporter receptor subunit TctC